MSILIRWQIDFTVSIPHNPQNDGSYAPAVQQPSQENAFDHDQCSVSRWCRQLDGLHQFDNYPGKVKSV